MFNSLLDTSNESSEQHLLFENYPFLVKWIVELWLTNTVKL